MFSSILKKGNNDREKSDIDASRIPAHIGIIMDGNGRWAKKRGLPRSAGHKVGADTLDKVARCCRDIGIKYLTVYAFSTENWSRPQDEVDTLMALFMKYLIKFQKEYKEEDRLILRIVGDRTAFNKEFNDQIDAIDKMMEGKQGMVLNLAINYGGRAEIINAIKEIIKNGEKAENINAETINKYLYTYPCPDPDLIIRTSGEMRISNFLTWQSAYSELYCPDVLWPDFSESNITDAIKEYQRRDRRFGKV